MKIPHLIAPRPGFLHNVRSQPFLFIGSALGLLAVAMLKGGWGGKRAANGGR